MLVTEISEKQSFWQKKTKKEKREFIVNGVLLVFVVFFAFGTVPLMKATLHTDYPLVVVSSGSMEPNIYRGDILIVKWKDPADIEAGSHTEWTGDVILYETVGLWSMPVDQPVVHRVVDKYYNDTEGKYYFITHGDANSRTDPPGSSVEIPVPEDHVYGVVVGRIPKLGYIKIWMAENGAFSILIVVGLGILLVISIITDVMESNKKKAEEKELESKDESKILTENDNNQTELPKTPPDD